ncbi:50S ribosomal protein L6 [Candidatus Woesearchaeota archaeon]|nr:MAG: 50S ribosomal protein L6 [Candidatus Woesearchaeota archaeon]
MKLEEIQETITLPEGVTASYEQEHHTLTLKGEKGELSRVFFHPRLLLRVDGQTITLTSRKATLREKKTLFTFASHIRNMVTGVSEGYTCKLKVCSGHFPMSVAVKGDRFEVKNFIGEKVPRTLTLKPGADVAVNGTEITVTGCDKELVGQIAADIEQLTRRPGFDSRIFQDGIFIVEKAGKHT